MWQIDGYDFSIHRLILSLSYIFSRVPAKDSSPDALKQPLNSQTEMSKCLLLHCPRTPTNSCKHPLFLLFILCFNTNTQSAVGEISTAVLRNLSHPETNYLPLTVCPKVFYFSYSTLIFQRYRFLIS